MKYILLSILTLLLYTQRYTGYGRGYDWDDNLNNGNTDTVFPIIAILIILVIGGIITLITKFKEKKGLKTGKYIQVINNGYKIVVPSSKVHLQPFEVIQTWKFEEFRKQFDSVEFNKQRLSIYKENIEGICCIKGTEKLTIYVEFECDADYMYRIYEYYVAKVKNGKYLLYKKG